MRRAGVICALWQTIPMSLSALQPLLSLTHCPVEQTVTVNVLSSPPLSPHFLLPLSEGGFADSYILVRSRGFLLMSKSLAGLWPQPDGQGQ